MCSSACAALDSTRRDSAVLTLRVVASLCLWAKYVLYVWELNEEQREMKPLLQYTIFSENLFLVMAVRCCSSATALQSRARKMYT